MAEKAQANPKNENQHRRHRWPVPLRKAARLIKGHHGRHISLVHLNSVLRGLRKSPDILRQYRALCRTYNAD